MATPPGPWATCPAPQQGHSGAYPIAGNTTAFDWRPQVPYDSLPRTLNPPSGFVVSANNRVQPVGQAPITADWDEGSDGYRARRITAMIAAGSAPPRKLTAADMAAIQSDVFSGSAADFVPALQSLAAAQPALFSARAAAALAVLGAWNKRAEVGSREQTLWAMTFLELSKYAKQPNPPPPPHPPTTHPPTHS